MDKIINKNIDKLKPKKDSVDKYTFFSDDENNHTLEYDIDMSDIYNREYKFDDDDSILDSFSKIYEEHNIEYKPREKLNLLELNIF